VAEPGDQRGLAAAPAVGSPESAEHAFFAEFLEAGEQAERAAGGVAADLAIGPSVVRVRFAGPAYADPVLRALGHLAAAAGSEYSAGPRSPDATVVVWDSASTGVAAPRLPWTHQSHGQPVGYDDSRFRIFLAPGMGGVTMFDTAERVGVVWAPSADGLAWWERAAPIRAALSWATVAPGRHLIHAGAVGVSGSHGVLLAGRGGSGKSTLALACVERGLDYAGDDYVLLATEPSPTAHAVYRSAKVDPASLDLVPAMRGAVSVAPAAPGDKAVLDVGRHRPERMASFVRVGAVVHPRITGVDGPVLRRLSARDALMTLVPSTVFQLPGDGESAMATLTELVRATPSFVLETGVDLAAAADAVASLVHT
jgi:hypothetical protein